MFGIHHGRSVHAPCVAFDLHVDKHIVFQSMFMKTIRKAVNRLCVSVSNLLKGGDRSSCLRGFPGVFAQEAFRTASGVQLASQGICWVVHILSSPTSSSCLSPSPSIPSHLPCLSRGYYIPPVTTYLPLLWGNVGGWLFGS